MKFPWDKYEEIPSVRKNTLQIFITTLCNLHCDGCFVRNFLGEEKSINLGEYERAILFAKEKGVEQINLLGGEPFLHPDLLRFLYINRHHGLKTTIYTNGYYLSRYSKEQLYGAKVRVSVYSYNKMPKPIVNIPLMKDFFDATYMVSSETTIEDLLLCARYAEDEYNCRVFFISSIRELDNPRQEFFDDTTLTMPVIKYKELVHNFLNEYNGDMEIHVSKRGVFESTVSSGFNTCRFSNYFIGGKIIQCPYDIVNQKFQEDYEYGKRFCQHSSSCMMTKVIYRRKK